MIENLEGEVWKSVIDYPDYEISNLGRVKALYKERKMPGDRGTLKYPEKLLKPWNLRNNTYLAVSLHKNGKQKKITVHRLVATHFIDNPENYPHILHLDDNGKNNRVENLRWGTVQHNMDLKVAHNRQHKGISTPNAKLNDTKCIEIREKYRNKEYNQYELADLYNVSQSVINEVINYKTWKHI